MQNFYLLMKACNLLSEEVEVETDNLATVKLIETWGGKFSSHSSLFQRTEC